MNVDSLRPSFSETEPYLYSVSELNREARELLSDCFFHIRVEGEISNLSQPSSGHVYFSLKDSAAQVRCAMFRPQLRRARFEFDNGQHVVVTAQAGIYEPRGDFQLIVEQIEDAGSGALQRAFLLLKAKLAAEGLFDAARKRPLPSTPRAIGVITSPSGAAIRDVMSVLRRRFAAIPVIIYPTAVQGQNAKLEIVKALQTANRRRECDVLIVARGGGSLEDLQAFNEEIVARAIAASVIPVIAGIGHETDITIADFAADLRAPTPSAAAEHAVPDQQVLLRQFQVYASRLRHQQQNQLQRQMQRLDWLDKRLQQLHPGRRLQHDAQRLAHMRVRLMQAWRIRLQRQQALVADLGARCGPLQPQTQIQALKLRQQFLTQRLNTAITLRLERAGERLAANSQALHTVSPLATLQRGYAIVTAGDNPAPLLSAAQVQIGTLLTTLLARGSLTSRVETLADEGTMTGTAE